VQNAGGVVPVFANDSGNSNATTRSAISAGTITVTDQANQKQDAANLSRDTSNTNGAVNKTPDLNNLLDTQSDLMSATTAAGEAVSKRIGEYADGKRDAAHTAEQKAIDAGNPELAAQYHQEALSWDESGDSRIALHVAGGGLIGGLGGGSIGNAARGAGMAAWAAGDLNRLANGTRDSLGGGDTAQMAGNVAANILAGGIGGLIGGGTGATTGSNVDFYNRSTGNGDGQGSTANSAVSWLADQFASAGRGAANMGSQFAALVNANGAQGPYLDPDDLNGPGGNSKPPAAGGSAVPVVVCVPPVCTVAVAPTPGMPGYVPGNATLNSEDGGADSSNVSNSTTQSGKSDSGSANVPSSILGSDGKLPGGIGGTGTPIPMEPTSNPSVTAEQFAKAAFNGQTPVKVVNNITGEGSWVAIMPDGTAITYRPAGQASAATATTTATVEINSAAVRNINNGNVAKFKFPGK
jgi:filamentous hemagglutinin